MGAYLFREAGTGHAQAAFRAVSERRCTAYVSPLLWAELQQVCRRKATRTTAISRDDVEVGYQFAAWLPLHTAPGEAFPPEHRAEVWSWMWDLQRPKGHPNDPDFLAMGRRHHMPIWTLDAKFRDFAHSDPALAGIVLLVGQDVVP